MWTLIATVLSTVLDWLGFGKPDPYKQGVAAGQSQATSADALGELADVQKASDARASISPDVSGMLNDPANTGPAKSGKPD